MKGLRLPTALVTCMMYALPLLSQEEIQFTKKDSVVVSSWIFGLGINVVDDAGSEFDNFFDAGDNWNVVPFPSRISVGRYFPNGLGLEAIGTYNQYQEGKIIDGEENVQDIDYYGIDFRVSYDLNKILGETAWFDPYVGVGAGYTDANNQGRGTYNASVGFRTWFSDNWGLDFNSSGKWTMNSDNSTNHIQHAAGVVYRIVNEKGLSKKGEEKLALLEEMEREQQRVDDSIAAANKAEEEARLLAEQLEREKEAARIAAEEKAKQEAEKIRRQKIEEAVAALGYVYFDLNSSYLNNKDKELLDKLTKILEEYPTLVLGVASHTDSRGSGKYNQWLSERRVKRTVDYLVSKGIAITRIRSAAFGENKLTNECDDRVYCSEEKHRANRRSEFEVIWTNN
ncbi:MAG: OmpA family protein [Bacteroidota bacterium]